MKNIKPIFVMGTARSGTTWLSNLLESHQEISATSCIEHHGIHESHLFDHTRYCFPNKVSCCEFVSKYKDEDYFKLLGTAEDEICNGKEGNESVFYWFRHLMDEFAQRHGTAWWLEKTPKHVIYYDYMLKEFPDALFIIIERKFQKTLHSNLTKYAKPDAGRIRQIAEKVLRYELDRRALKRLRKAAPEKVFSVRYEDLVSSTDTEIKRIELFIKVSIMPLTSRYEADSSYKSTDEPYKMSLIEWLITYIIKTISKLVPFEMQRAVRMSRDRKSAEIFPLYTRVRKARSSEYHIK